MGSINFENDLQTWHYTHTLVYPHVHTHIHILTDTFTHTNVHTLLQTLTHALHIQIFACLHTHFTPLLHTLALSLTNINMLTLTLKSNIVKFSLFFKQQFLCKHYYQWRVSLESMLNKFVSSIQSSWLYQTELLYRCAIDRVSYEDLSRNPYCESLLGAQFLVDTDT